jgi:hypothetical protein
VLAVLLVLGTWQMRRLHWKEAVLAQLAVAETAAPVPLDTALPQPWTIALKPTRSTSEHRVKMPEQHRHAQRCRCWRFVRHQNGISSSMPSVIGPSPKSSAWG